ncbi:MAG: tetratricopeptide repeat protein [Spirochaetia bacterium]|jgi:tetratricopeptide (TPR) repeat protein
MRSPDYEALLREALEAGKRRDYPRAVELLTRIVGSTDSLPQASLYLGRALHAVGDYARAAQVLNFFLRERPDSLPGRFFLGRAYLALEEYQEAIRHLKKAVEKDPGFSPAYGLLGLACLKTRRPDKAIWWFAKALEIDPQNKRLQVGYLNTALVLAIRLFYRGDLTDAARLFTEVLEQRRESILPHLYLASIYRELHKDNLALYHMDAASNISPQDPFLHLQKALILLSQGNEAAAGVEIKNATGLMRSAVGPTSSPEDILRFITVNLFKEKRYRETVFYGAKLLKGAYDDPPLHALVAEAYRNLGDLLKAKNHYLRAIEKDRASLELRYGLLAVLWERREFKELLAEAARLLQKDRANGPGRYFHSLALSRTDAAIEQVLAELQQQVKAHGPDPVLMAELAAAYVRAGMPELAEGWYQRVLKILPDDPDNLLALAVVYAGLGKRTEQGEVMQKYLAIHPEDRMVRRELVHLLLQQEAFAAAADHLTTLLPLEPGNAKLKATLALCYRRTKRYPEALVLLRDLMMASPEAEELMKAAVYCLDKMGARAVAVRALESFMKQHGENLSLTLMLGVLHFQAGSMEKAAETFRKAVSASPRDWRANRNLGMVYRKIGNDTFAEKFLARAAEYRAAAEAPAPKRR